MSQSFSKILRISRTYNSHSNLTSTSHLSELHDYVQQKFRRSFLPGKRMTVTFIDSSGRHDPAITITFAS